MADTLAPVLEGGVPPPPPSIDNEPSLAGIQPIPTKSNTTQHTHLLTHTPHTAAAHAGRCMCGASRKVLMIVNSFIINTVDFLNKLNAVSEHKLRQVQQHIQRVEITLALLEGKLDSVPWLSHRTAHTDAACMRFICLASSHSFGFASIWSVKCSRRPATTANCRRCCSTYQRRTRRPIPRLLLPLPAPTTLLLSLSAHLTPATERRRALQEVLQDAGHGCTEAGAAW